MADKEIVAPDGTMSPGALSDLVTPTDIEQARQWMRNDLEKSLGRLSMGFHDGLLGGISDALGGVAREGFEDFTREVEKVIGGLRTIAEGAAEQARIIIQEIMKALDPGIGALPTPEEALAEITKWSEKIRAIHIILFGHQQVTDSRLQVIENSVNHLLDGGTMSIFAQSSTFKNPGPGMQVTVACIGGGQAGMKGGAVFEGGGVGGVGGGFTAVNFRSDDLPAEIPVIIGTGGLSDGAHGTPTIFGPADNPYMQSGASGTFSVPVDYGEIPELGIKPGAGGKGCSYNTIPIPIKISSGEAGTSTALGNGGAPGNDAPDLVNPVWPCGGGGGGGSDASAQNGCRGGWPGGGGGGGCAYGTAISSTDGGPGAAGACLITVKKGL